MATGHLMGHIERLREKPEHVRHRIALLTSAGATALVAILWVTAMAASGTLALKTETVASSAAGTGSDVKEALAEPASAFSNLMGAAGAAFGATSTEAALRIIETRTSSTLDSQTKPANDTSKTVIPF